MVIPQYKLYFYALLLYKCRSVLILFILCIKLIKGRMRIFDGACYLGDPLSSYNFVLSYFDYMDTHQKENLKPTSIKYMANITVYVTS